MEVRLRLAIFVTAFGVVLLASAVIGRFSFPERWEYSRIAENILQGRGASYEYLGTTYYSYGPPLYPLLLAAALKITHGSEASMLVLQAVLFAMTAVVVYALAQSFFGRTEACLAAFLACLHPGGLIYGGKLHSQTLDVFLVTLSFLVFSRLSIDSSALRAFGSGIVGGLAALSRGTILPFFLFWSAWIVWKKRRQFFAVVTLLLCVALGAALVIGPFLVRSYLFYGEWAPLRTDTGVNLWYGNHPGASGTSYTLSSPSVPVISTLDPMLSSRLFGSNEIDQNRIFTAAALKFIQEEPAAADTKILK